MNHIFDGTEGIVNISLDIFKFQVKIAFNLDEGSLIEYCSKGYSI